MLKHEIDAELHFGKVLLSATKFLSSIRIINNMTSNSLFKKIFIAY